jgi:subtilisin family serine protease
LLQIEWKESCANVQGNKVKLMKIALLLIASIGALLATSSSVATQPTALFAEGEILIQFRSDAGPGAQADVRNRIGAVRKKLIRRDEQGELELAQIPAGRVAAALAAIQRHPSVTFVEPNWIYQHQATPNDPSYTNGSLWGVYGDLSSPTNQFGSQAAEVWAGGSTGGASVVVGVIDEGIDLNHPDLAGNLWTNPFDPLDGIDNDGNGYIDDIHGWDFYSDDNSIYDGPGDNHGTHVAGTIGAVGNNGVGVTGVNWDVTIVAVKFLGPSTGSTADAIRAVDYLTDLKQRHGMNIVATNNSWGGGGYSAGLHSAIIRAAKEGILFVAAAGNSTNNNDLWPFYPANFNTTVASSTETAAAYDSVISVAAITSTGGRASFSNYGANTVDLGAPGAGILSTTPANTYSFYSGTSMAAPHVTGGLALYFSMLPAATAAQARTQILNGALVTPTASLAGVTATGGRLNLSELSAAPADPNLIVTAVGNPPAVLLLKQKFTSSDTVRNDGGASAGDSRTYFYLSLDTVKGAGDKLFGQKRLVPSLDPAESSTGTKSLTVPANTPLGVYYLLACADGDNTVTESDETDNCRASATTVEVRAPNLRTTAVSNPPASAPRGSSFSVTDTASNSGNASAGASTTRYYLSLSAKKDSQSVMLSNTRAVPPLATGANSAGSATVSIPAAIPAGNYYLLACSDDAKKVAESNEKDNCKAAATQITVTP